MNISKRGDHLFAAGLWKAVGDVAKSVRTQVGEYSEGRVLANALFELQRDLGGSEFDVTINQGRPVTGSDPHSLRFGQAVRRFRLDMEALVFALKHRRSIDERDPGLRTDALTQANSQLATAKQYAMLTIGRFFDAVVDPDVLDQMLASDPNTRARRSATGAEVATTRLRLGSLRYRIVGAISQM
ncbi:hypothetical protein BLA9940_05566 [Burkholderia aenigmatica]|uniref:Uncharacterized protein n=1 Tax=Burkholderia aenigmatica TaxID=2015348 RepID=A0A6J5JAB4_9BURK|nr:MULTISPECIES: hypothetical protein [Burkholderia]AYQ41666.1 hypothetical protein CVS37_27385 [Burkholderia lata]UKD13465.1 hypothetical protein L3V59_27560 [Burkholderia aenigmatica]CAB3968391.1 hypothetical protein BLA3211_04958 [Burkholderia aenigmatica]VWC81562.1 hypothetical protein BLA17378_03955 [Burkholderia aenigmatica]VWC92609.1 hypothetical protein BLA9940_05566 [Burkholderia aenigmatica]